MIMMQNIYITIFLVCGVIVSVIVFSVVSRKFKSRLINYCMLQKNFSGELDQRAPVVRNDEIGRISGPLTKLRMLCSRR